MKAPERYVLHTLPVMFFSVVRIEGEFGMFLVSFIGVLLFLMPSTPHWINPIG
jgi:hypothetical protein